MNVTWSSVTGSEREENRDYGIYIKLSSMDLLMVIDGGNKGTRPEKFVSHFVDLFCHSIKQNPAVNNPDKLIKVLECTRKQMSDTYTEETLCYSIILFNHETKSCWGICCGDCRIGSFSPQTKQLIWRTNVHTLANWDGRFFSDEHIHKAGSSKVTRCFKMKKSYAPDVVKLDYEVQSWCLATDGYWLERHLLGVSNTTDDMSLLVFARDKENMEINNPTNFYYA